MNKLIHLSEGNPAQTRSALVVLLKHQLVVYSIEENGVAYYEPHFENTYNATIRLGSLIRLVEERYSEQASEIFDTILQSGVVRVEDLFDIIREHYEEEAANAAKHDSPRSERSVENDDSGISGVSAVHAVHAPSKLWTQPEQTAALEDMRGNLQLLLQSGLIEHISDKQFMPAYDLTREVEAAAVAYAATSNVGGAKGRQELHGHLDKIRRDWRDAPHSYFTNNHHRTGSKRARSTNLAIEDEDDVVAQPSKRQKATKHSFNPVSSNRCSTLTPGQKPLEVSLSCAQQCVPDRIFTKRCSMS